MQIARTPLQIVSGFLGAGKTTALSRFLKHHGGGERFALVVNDFASSGIDGLTLEGHGKDGFTVHSVPGGCVCCSSAVFLHQALIKILRKEKPARIYLEPTGLAEPAEIIDMLARSELAPYLEICPTVVLVDPRRDLEKLMSTQPLVQAQIEGADVLVANFADVTPPERMKTFLKWAASLEPQKQEIIMATYGEVPERVFRLPGRPLRAVAPLLGSADVFEKPQNKKGFVGKSFFWPATLVFDHDALGDFFDRLPTLANFARAKGYFHTTRNWYRLESVAPVLSGGPMRFDSAAAHYRRDNRLDLIFAEPINDALWRTLESELQNCVSLDRSPCVPA